MLVKLGSSVKHVDYNNLKGQNYTTENRSKWSFGCQFDLILIFSRKTVTLALSVIKSKSMVTADRSYYASQFLAHTMFLPFFPTEAMLWTFGTLQGSIYTVCSLISNKIALTTDVWHFAGQHLYYASQFLADAMSNVTIDIWDFAWQHLYYLLSNEIAITTDVWDFAGQHV
ncbi:unnamed protein product, partial [Pocillopora meandrina]